MPSERVQHHIDRLLDEADQAFAHQDWSALQSVARQALLLDAANEDAQALLTTAEGMLAGEGASRGSSGVAETPLPGLHPSSPALLPQGEKGDILPASFANGRYTVKRFLGEGGKKRVYLAHDTTLDRDVAFALIKTDGLDDAGRERITREAQAMGKLGTHPHIVTVFDLGTEVVGHGSSVVDGTGSTTQDPGATTTAQPYMVTELMGGGDVEGAIEQAPEHKLPLLQTLAIAEQVCQGLEFAHSHGIVHRDLKPGNVWLAESLQPLAISRQHPGPTTHEPRPTTPVAKIGDFGLAVAIDRTRLTQAG
ncbi:MAG TPA: serine/threonine-protein kinase, partial [Dehalococcoidia bacterium]|nr:serine/threonine-protein kinase [Dehalococcoidia bacterium]